MVPDDFSALDLARFEVTLRALEPAYLPQFLGSTFRGAFGQALKQAVCVVEHGDCSRCPVLNQCTYPYLFETPVPPGITQLRGQERAPGPFIIEPPIVESAVRRVWRMPLSSGAAASRSANGNSAPLGTAPSLTLAGKSTFAASARDSFNPRPVMVNPQPANTSAAFLDRPRGFIPGDALSFGLTLIGRAIDSLPYVVFAVREMSGAGLGANRSRFELKEVSAKGPAGERYRVYSTRSDTIREAPRESLSEFIKAGMRALESSAAKRQHVKLKFLTPARIRVRDDLQTGLSFELLTRNLLRRVSMLAAVHGEGRMDLDYRGLIDRAATVRTCSSNLKWWDLERYSNRQQEKLRVGGLIGEIEYEGGAVEEFLPLLAAGELLQVGTGASAGLGRYRILECGDYSPLS